MTLQVHHVIVADRRRAEVFRHYTIEIEKHAVGQYRASVRSAEHSKELGLHPSYFTAREVAFTWINEIEEIKDRSWGPYDRPLKNSLPELVPTVTPRYPEWESLSRNEQIRMMRKHNMGLREIAQEFGISMQRVSQIANAVEPNEELEEAHD